MDTKKLHLYLEVAPQGLSEPKKSAKLLHIKQHYLQRWNVSEQILPMNHYHQPHDQ